MSSVTLPRSGFSKASLLVSVAAAFLLAGCSNAVERFSENPSDSDPVYTASVPKKNAAPPAADDSGDVISSKPLASAAPTKPLYNYNTAQTAPVAPINETPAYKQPAPQVAAAPQAEGSVTVGQGMTLYSIAKANHTSVAKLASFNGLKPPYAVHEGQVLKVPGVASAAMPEPAPQVAQAEEPQLEPLKKKSGNTASGGTHKVASGETLFSLGRKYGVSPFAIADLNGLPHDKGLALGQMLKIPGAGGTPVAQKPAKSTGTADDTQTAQADDGDKGDAAVTPDSKAAPKVAQNVPPPAVDQTAPKPKVSADSGVAGMRWPVRGKIISEFGNKPNGLKNEGINIAVPEGTSIRAADDGVVAYAGNELKGYGNLVLVRHAGGWVTAYAHAKELFVKRGDTVKRGDVIAKAGQTGSVDSPQLHFEVRKGAVAMDPLKYLDSATASN
jgi:murein DD-endopeptidase MepM/ murein hydrolase activator NlpD